MEDNFKKIFNSKLSDIMQKYKDVDDKDDYEFDIENNAIYRQQDLDCKISGVCKNDRKQKKIQELKEGLKEYKELYELVFGED